MKTIAEIKQDINKKIKENHNEEITGTILNGVLNDMADTLAAPNTAGVTINLANSQDVSFKGESFSGSLADVLPFLGAKINGYNASSAQGDIMLTEEQYKDVIAGKPLAISVAGNRYFLSKLSEGLYGGYAYGVEAESSARVLTHTMHNICRLDINMMVALSNLEGVYKATVIIGAKRTIIRLDIPFKADGSQDTAILPTPTNFRSGEGARTFVFISISGRMASMCGSVIRGGDMEDVGNADILYIPTWAAMEDTTIVRFCQGNNWESDKVATYNIEISHKSVEGNDRGVITMAKYCVGGLRSKYSSGKVLYLGASWGCDSHNADLGFYWDEFIRNRQ